MQSLSVGTSLSVSKKDRYDSGVMKMTRVCSGLMKMTQA